MIKYYITATNGCNPSRVLSARSWVRAKRIAYQLKLAGWHVNIKQTKIGKEN